MHRMVVLLMLGVLSLGCDREPEYPQGGPPSGIAPMANVEWAARRQQLTAAFGDLDREANRLYTTKSMPSFTAAVLVDGELAWWRGFGVQDLSEGGPIAVTTVYRIASITKIITAMAAVMLRDEGKVSLDAPVGNWIPEIDEVVYPTQERPRITLRHLMTHTSGLPRVGPIDYVTDRTPPLSEREILVALRGLQLERTPGIESHYSNLGYAVLGLALGRAAGEPFADLVQRRLLQAMGMRCQWSLDAVSRAELATGYVREGYDLVPRHHWPMGAGEGMGGLYCSLDDMIRFASFQMTAWPPGGRPDRPPLSNASLRESQLGGGHQRVGGKQVGYGWQVGNAGKAGLMIWHTGSTHQYASELVVLPDQRIAIVALTNVGDEAPVSAFVGFARRRLMKELGM